jgi:hypothetical protein
MSMVKIVPHERGEGLANLLIAAPHPTRWCCGTAEGTSDRRVPIGAASFVKIVERQWESLPILHMLAHLRRRSKRLLKGFGRHCRNFLKFSDGYFAQT